MKIGTKFSRLSLKKISDIIDNHKKYTDFNRLGLYRAIYESTKLSLDEKLELREKANSAFPKYFEFLQVKDPETYFNVKTLGEELTKGEFDQFWADLRKNQQRILKDKKIKHRNFGVYSKHNCGINGCPLDGIMIKQGSFMQESHLWFKSDNPNFTRRDKSDRNKFDRKNKKQLIDRVLDEE